MQKIKHRVFNRILKAGLTKAELDVLLYLSHYQDDTGKVVGVYYKDVCSALDIVFQTYYDALRHLEQKGIITARKAHYRDWDVCILDNSFTNGMEGYISTGDDLFFDPDFQAMKPGEKLLAMQFLKITKNPQNGGKYRREAGELIKQYCEILGVTKRVLLRYFKRLKRYFSIGMLKGVYYIRPLRGVGCKSEDHPERKDKELCREQISRAVLRRERAVCTEETIRDTSNLLVQYANILKEKAAIVFQEAVEASIHRRNAGIRNPYRWNRELHPEYIHMLLKEKITKMETALCRPM